MARPPVEKSHVERPGPADFRDPLVHRELQRAAVWFGVALLIAGVIVLAQPLLLIIGGIILAVMLDGGARLIGRVLPIGRGWRLLVVILLVFGFIGWTFYYAGSTFVAQFETLRIVVDAQLERVVAWAGRVGLVPEGSTLGSIGGPELKPTRHRSERPRSSGPLALAPVASTRMGGVAAISSIRDPD